MAHIKRSLWEAHGKELLLERPYLPSIILYKMFWRNNLILHVQVIKLGFTTLKSHVPFISSTCAVG